MTSTMRLLAPVLLLALAGCSASSYCEDQQDYELAGSVPPLKGDESLSVPQSEAALRIPPRPANAVPFGEPYKDEEGDDDVRCLDKPPEMPALVEAKPAEPAPAPPAQMPPQQQAPSQPETPVTEPAPEDAPSAEPSPG